MGNSTLLGSGSLNDMLEILRLIILLSTEYGTNTGTVHITRQIHGTGVDAISRS